jgi:hypothetical protein
LIVSNEDGGCSYRLPNTTNLVALLPARRNQDRSLPLL